jgi:hypothetical protein
MAFVTRIEEKWLLRVRMMEFLLVARSAQYFLIANRPSTR